MSLFNSGVRPVIDSYLLEEAKKVRDYGDYWSASSAGYCMRKVIFERLGVPKIESTGDARKQRVFSSGHIFHSWIQELTKKAGLSIAQELELQDEDLMIRGHIDDLVLVGGSPKSEYVGADTVLPYATKESSITKKELAQAMKEESRDSWDKEQLKKLLETAPTQHLILYDYKTQNSRAFSYKRPDMSHYHRMQLGTYMYMLRKDWKYDYSDFDNTGALKGVELEEARILKISKDDLRMSEEQLLWSPELEKEVVGYWRTLNGYWKNKKMPKCTCADYEGGFLAKEAYNGYYYEGEPCSLKYYEQWKKKEKANV